MMLGFCEMSRNKRRKWVVACLIICLMGGWELLAITLPNNNIFNTNTSTTRSKEGLIKDGKDSENQQQQQQHQGFMEAEISDFDVADKPTPSQAPAEDAGDHLHQDIAKISVSVTSGDLTGSLGRQKDDQDDQMKQQDQQHQEKHVLPRPIYSETHPSHSKTNNTSTKRVTIVVQLSGEMANNLQHIAHGVGLKLWAKHDYGIDANIVLRHFVGANNRAPKPKWKTARSAIQQCFPNVAHWDFTQGNSADFTRIQSQQRQWLGGRSDHLFGLINSQHASEIQKGLNFLANDILQDPLRPASGIEEEDAFTSIRIPYLYSESLDVFPMVDKYYEELRHLFTLNETACCAQLPQPDELVFHFRNYQSEMPSHRAYDMGFAELSPDKTARELFAHLLRNQPGSWNNPTSGTTSTGSRVAITTRIVNQAARDYIVSLESTRRIASARLVTGQTGVQDFCFLAKAKAALLGHARSTFVLWAGLIGNASTVRLYNVDNWGIRKRHSDRFINRFTYNWTNPLLQDRVLFELYQAEEMDRFHVGH